MVGLTLIALLLFGAVWVVHYLLQVLIGLSIDVEEAELEAASSPTCYKHLKSISILRSLEIVIATVFTAVLPIVGIVVGTLLPDPVRAMLSGTVGEKTVIAVSIAALFAYYSIFRTLRKQQGPRVRTAIIKLFKREPVPATANPGERG